LGIRSNYLLHVGALAYRKNIPTLLRAVAHLRESGKLNSRQLVLAGSESPGISGAQEIYQTIQELDLTHTVVLAGHVPDDYLAGLYAEAEILVMPSLYEGFGLPVLEAMASGTPVVSSNTSSLPEVGGSAALYFPPEDHDALSQNLEAVLTNGSLAADMRSKGLKRAAEFSWERTATETIQVYRDVVKGR
jgi:glycosyltransferase involved in cell wall biosynthesis